MINVSDTAVILRFALGIGSEREFASCCEIKFAVAVYCERLLLLSFARLVNYAFRNQERLAMKSRIVIPLLLLCGAAIWPAIPFVRGQQTKSKPKVGYHPAANPEQKKTVFLSDFHPAA